MSCAGVCACICIVLMYQVIATRCVSERGIEAKEDRKTVNAVRMRLSLASKTVEKNSRGKQAKLVNHLSGRFAELD